MKIYNKLVRDNIPQIIKEKGDDCSFYNANHEEYLGKLKHKLSEEIEELYDYPCEEEMADILEVLEAIQKYYKLDSNKIEAIKKSKNEERGSFENHTILEFVLERNYTT